MKQAILWAALSLAVPAHAVHKCNVNGKILYQDAPCSFGDKPIKLQDNKGTSLLKGQEQSAQWVMNRHRTPASLAKVGTASQTGASVPSSGWKPSNAVDEAKARDDQAREDWNQRGRERLAREDEEAVARAAAALAGRPVPRPAARRLPGTR